MNKEIKERYKKTKFAKGGGSCFECCDYEEMDTEIREFVQKEIEEAIKQERQRIIEEIKKLKVISPNVEPPKNKLSQNQIFIAGQMNVFMRLEDIIKNIK